MTEEVKHEEVVFGKSPSFEEINRNYVKRQQKLLGKESKATELVEKLKKLLREKIDADEDIDGLDFELVEAAVEDEETTEDAPKSKKKKAK
jgi:phage I-like protein